MSQIGSQDASEVATEYDLGEDVDYEQRADIAIPSYSH
jgi:hypothetical protein